MSEANRSGGCITQAIAEERVLQSLALAEWSTTMWRENPGFSKRPGRKVEEFMLALTEVQRRHAAD